jgi:hypothetical protein
MECLRLSAEESTLRTSVYLSDRDYTNVNNAFTLQCDHYYKYMCKLGLLRAVPFQQCFLEHRCRWLDLSGLLCSIAHTLEQLLAD